MSDQQNELLLAVGRLEGKMDSMQADFRDSKANLAKADAALATRDDEIESRLRIVESRWAWALGACAVVSMAAPYVRDLLHK